MKPGILNTEKKNNLIKAVNNIYTFYRDGFRGMVLGKKLWKIILIKLFVMFVILKLFFFPNFLNTKFQTDEEKGNYVLEQITRSASLNKLE
ncbi:MAG: DUF4492 domain-containing protein [Desulfobacula sp.]|nr:DUF4492 domain-containing protein [Desulfobacula sp.]